MNNVTPSNWTESKISNFAKVTDGAHKTPNYIQSGIPFLRVTDMRNQDVFSGSIKYISKEEHGELIKRCKPEKNDILYSKNGTIGITRIVDWDREFSIFVSLALIKLKTNSVKPIFLKYFLESDVAWKQIRDRSKQGTVTNLHLEEIREFDISLPPLPEQQKIATILTSVDNVIDKTQAQINKLQALKKGMMQELLSPREGSKQAKEFGHTEFKGSPVGRIPKGWEVKTLGEVTIEKGLQTGPFGSQLHAHEYVDQGIPVVMPKDMKNNKIDQSSIARITQEKATQLQKHKTVQGDVLFSRRGDIGRFALVEAGNAGWICGTGCLRARFNNDVSAEFIASYLTLAPIIEWLNCNAVGQTMLNLNTSILSQLPVIVPPREEQKIIANTIVATDGRTNSLKSKLHSLSELKKALMQDLLTGKVRVLTNKSEKEAAVG